MIYINRFKKFLLNGLLLSAAAILMRSVAVAFNVYVSSKVGAEGMGLLNLTSTVYGFAVTLATSGINLAVVRLVSGALPYGNEDYFDKKADRRVHKIMRNALFYCLFFSILSSTLLFFGSRVIGTYALGDVRTIPSLRLLAFTLTPISLSSALNGYFNAVRRVYKNVIVQICEQAAKITVVSSLLILIGPCGLEYACIAVVAGGAVSEAVCVLISATLFFFDRKIHKSKRFENSTIQRNAYTPSGISSSRGVNFGKAKLTATQSEPPEKSSIVSIALPVAISTYVRSALLTIEHLAIPWGLKKSGASASQALASYGVLHGMVFPILLFPASVLTAFASLLIPELSSAHEKGDTRRIESIASRVFRFTLLFGIGVGGIFVCFATELGGIIYNNAESSEFIRLLAPLIPLMYLDSAVDAMLKGLGEQLYTMRVNIADALMSVILVIALLPSMGIKGYVTVIFLMELFNTTLSVLKLLSITKIKTHIGTWVFVPLFSIIFSTVITRIVFDSKNVLSLTLSLLDIKALAFLEILFCAVLYLIFSSVFGKLGTLARKKIKCFS